MPKFNVKKFFKGENVYGFGDKEYSYAFTKFAAIKMPKDHPMRDEIAKDIKFAVWDAEVSKKKSVQVIPEMLNTEILTENVVNLSSICVKTNHCIARLFYTDYEGVTYPILLNSKYVDMLELWSMKAYMPVPSDNYKPMIFKDDDGLEVAVMPIANCRYLKKDELIKLSNAYGVI